MCVGSIPTMHTHTIILIRTETTMVYNGGFKTMNTKYNFRGEKFTYTSQKELRKAFFEMCNELNIETKGKKTKFDLTLNITFNDWKDGLRKDGLISEKLVNNATLY